MYGLILALLAKYYSYTREHALLLKYRAKLRAITELLIDLHESSLRLPPDDPGHGLIHGWAESDFCMFPDPARLWQPYFGNSAFTARGFREHARLWQEIARAVAQPDLENEARDLITRSDILRRDLIAGIERSIRKDMTPAYVAPLAGSMRHTFDEAREFNPHGPLSYYPRTYAELLQADMVPPNRTAQEAANWVEYCNGTGDTPYGNRRRKYGHQQPHRVRYWGLGNEPWRMPTENYARAAFACFANGHDQSLGISVCRD